MLESSLRLDDSLDEKKAIASAPVSPPMSSRHVLPRRSSTPALSPRSPDGTPGPIFLFTSPSPSLVTNPPPPPHLARSASVPLLDMAIQPAYFDDTLRSEDAVTAKPANGCPRPMDLPSAPDAKVQPPAVQEVAAPLDPMPDLDDISQLLRQARYQKQRRVQTQRLFHRLQTISSRTQRLVAASRHVRRTLADCLRSEDKHSFAHLFNTYHNACDQSTSLSSTDSPDLEPATSHRADQPTDFLESISTSSRETILQLLTRLRYDKRFVADRIVLLSQRELTSLLSDGSTSRHGDSVLGGSQRSSTRSAKPLGFVVDRVVDDLSAGSFRTPLETVVNTQNPLGQGGLAYSRSTDTWAHVAARVIAERKPSGDHLTSALLDIWAFQAEWPGRERLRTWMLHTLRRGQFLLEQPSRQSFRMRIQGQVDLSAEETARTELFYKESVDQLLELLGNVHGASLIPEAAMDFALAIHDNLADAPEHRRDLPSFLTTRWLFGHFLMDLLVLPEGHGLLNGHHISDLARQKILREVATRCHKAVSDVVHAWKHAGALSIDTVDRVQKVIARFDFSCTPNGYSGAANASPSAGAPREHFLAVSATDTLTIMNALFPARRPVSVSSDHDTLRSGLQSSASSVSGFSLFRSTNAAGPVWSPASYFPLTTASPGQLSAPVDNRSAMVPPFEDAFAMDPDVMDARSELEEYSAAHRTNECTHWAHLVCSDYDEHVDTYSRVLELERRPHRLPREHAAGKIPPKMPASLKAAIETLITDVHDGLFHEQPVGLATVGDAVALSERLFMLFDLQITDCEFQQDFVAAHTWLAHMEAYDAFLHVHGLGSLVSMMTDIEGSTKASLDTSAAVLNRCDEWLGIVRPLVALQASQIERMANSNQALRTKMWYTADVRTSSVYENVRAFTSALRIMGKPRKQGVAKQAPPLRHWSGARMSNQNQNVHLKSEAQILDLLSTIPDYGGPNKLSDDQSKLTWTWMRRNDVQLICAGEERLHKLCMEIRKCVEHLLNPSPHDNPLLWSNLLFSRDLAETPRPTSSGSRFCAPETSTRHLDLLSLQTRPSASIDTISHLSHTLSSASSRDYFDRSPTLAAKSSTAFWSPAATELRSLSSTTSIASHMARGFDSSPPRPTLSPSTSKTQAIDDLREQLTGLLLSDMGASLFSRGSETDIAFLDKLGGNLTEQHLAARVALASRDQANDTSRVPRSQHIMRHRPSFDFEHAFRTMFELFSIDCDPFAKLRTLNDIQRLLRPYMAQQKRTADAFPPTDDTSARLLQPAAGKHTTPDSDLMTEGFFALFCQRSIRPTALFRDLQYIASLVPSTILDSTSRGQAFWNAAVAAIRLKSEARKKLVETADSIINYHTNNRGHGRSASSAQQQRDSATFATPSRTPSAELIAHYSMADAAYLLQITAREGDPAAQRELATLYLTHPELMDHIIAPFAAPGEVFRDEIEGRWKRDRDPQRCDPRTMCVAHHWMVLGAKGGDALAGEFLRQREEMERLP